MGGSAGRAAEPALARGSRPGKAGSASLGTTADDVDYELRLLESVAALGWPVAPAIGRPIQFGGHLWSLFPFLPGEPPSALDPAADQRARGRLLAEFHAGLVSLDTFGQRGTWRRCEQILADPALDRILNEHEREHSEEVRSFGGIWTERGGAQPNCRFGIGPASSFMATSQRGICVFKTGGSPVSSTLNWRIGPPNRGLRAFLAGQIRCSDRGL